MHHQMNQPTCRGPRPIPQQVPGPPQQVEAHSRHARARDVLDRVGHGVGYVKHGGPAGLLEQAVPRALVVPGEEADPAPQPVIEVVGFDDPDEVFLDHVGGTEHRAAPGERQDLAGDGMRLHREVALREPKVEPGAHPLWAVDDGSLGGCDGVQLRPRGEQGQTFAQEPRLQHAIPVQEDDGIVPRGPPARDRTQRVADGVALTGPALADDHDLEVHAHRPARDVFAQDPLVPRIARSHVDAGRDADVPAFGDDALEDLLGGFPSLLERRDHEVHDPGPPAGIPELVGVAPEPREEEEAVEGRADRVRHPPQVAPDGDPADREQDAPPHAVRRLRRHAIAERDRHRDVDEEPVDVAQSELESHRPGGRTHHRAKDLMDAII